jgi:hypothetical protein
MVAPSAPSPPGSHDISAAEIAKWYGRSSLELREEIATKLNKMRWPTDPKTPDNEQKEQRHPLDDVYFWDTKAAAKAIRLLVEEVLPDASHLARILENPRFPQTQDLWKKIGALKLGLAELLEFIEWPFGPPSSIYRNGYKRPKDWHVFAVAVAKVIIDASAKLGLPEPAITENSRLASAVHHALIRMGVRSVTTVGAGAVGSHLVRWVKRGGSLVARK